MNLKNQIFILLAIFLLWPSLAKSAQKPPNILLTASDDQGYRDFGCFGGIEIKTPNLDRLAKEGIRATSFYVTWPACTPSRASLLTRLYPQRNGLYDMILTGSITAINIRATSFHSHQR